MMLENEITPGPSLPASFTLPNCIFEDLCPGDDIAKCDPIALHRPETKNLRFF